MKLNSWQKVQYRLLWWSCRAVGLLPERVLYFCLGGLIRLILYRLVRYRRQVVRTNLAHSFPEKSEAERREIERKFYHNLSEVFVDTILLASISRKRICERMVYSNVEEVEAAMSGRSWISAMSHFGSWELTINYVCHTDHNVLAVYRPLHNRVFDRFYHEARSRFGTQPVAMNDTLREVIRGHRPGERPVIVAMIADQTPPVEEIKHWFRFLNQDTPFFSGLEKISTRFGMPVYFMYIRKCAPHCYDAELQLIYDGKEHLEEYELTRRYIDKLEMMIRESPELWMWSHKRWKHSRESVARHRESVRKAAAEKKLTAGQKISTKGI